MIYLSEAANPLLISYLKTIDDVTAIRATTLVYSQIASHCDIYMCALGIGRDSKLVYANADEPGFSYPEDVAFNAACTGKFFIHNTRFTAPRLLAAAEESNQKIINVKQGYTKCNIAIIDENSIITSDRGIAEAVKGRGPDCLLISEGQIELEGFDYGFIGGTCGRIDDTIVFNGDITAHRDYAIIADFIGARGLKIKHFHYPLADIGSIIRSSDVITDERPYL